MRRITSGNIDDTVRLKLQVIEAVTSADAPEVIGLTVTLRRNDNQSSVVSVYLPKGTENYTLVRAAVDSQLYSDRIDAQTYLNNLGLADAIGDFILSTRFTDQNVFYRPVLLSVNGATASRVSSTSQFYAPGVTIHSDPSLVTNTSIFYLPTVAQV